MTIEKPISKNAIFVGGAARFFDLIFVIAQDKALNELDTKHTRFIAFDRDEFAFNGDTHWTACAVCVVQQPGIKMVALGIEGNVFTFAGGASEEEQLKPKPKVMRNLGVIDGIAYACGMAREVYRREGDNIWVSMNAPRKGKEIVGFEAIDGFDRSEIYAVGLKGDIWEWNSSKWTQHASPTNVILHGVCCTENSEVIICGQHGMLIMGRGSSWDTIDVGDFVADFWDVHYFNDTIYLATMFNLFTYSKEIGLKAVDFGDDAPTSCYRLTSAEGVLWSVGSADIFSFDGTTWTRID